MAREVEHTGRRMGEKARESKINIEGERQRQSERDLVKLCDGTMLLS